MIAINRASKARIYPNKAQNSKIDQTLGCCRYVYNHMLARNQKAYKRRGEHLSYISMQNLLPEMKKYHTWLADADSQALKYACRQLDTAFKKFFKRETGYPNYHKKHGRQSYTTTNASAIHISEDCRRIKIPCLGWVKVRGLYIPDGAKINYVTVSRDTDESYYVSVNYKYEVDMEVHDSNSSITPSILGLDYKSDGLFVDSDGNCADMPHWFRESQAKLARQQRILSRRRGSRKGESKSCGWKKQHRKVAKIQRRVANQRIDYLHKESKRLAEAYDIVAAEDLDMKAISNHSFGNGKATLDNGYGMFLTMLDYKLSAQGKQLVIVDKWYPSSQICHCCGYQDKRLKDLRIRGWICPQCGVTHDRDINAAINIRNEAIRMMKAA